MTMTSTVPPGMPQSIDESYPAVPESVAAARHSVSRWLSAQSADVVMSGDIGIAVSEACTNVVHHGYRGENSGAFLIHAESVGGAVWVTVSDDGAGIVPRSDSQGLGLGLPLMGLLTDDLEFGSAEDGTGTVVTMRFTAAGARGRLAAR